MTCAVNNVRTSGLSKQIETFKLIEGTQFFLSSFSLFSVSLVPIAQQDMGLCHLPFSKLEPVPGL